MLPVKMARTPLWSDKLQQAHYPGDCGASQQAGVREDSEDWAYTGDLGDGQGSRGPLWTEAG